MLGSLGMLALLADQAAGKFRRHHELRDLPDVFCFLGALSALAGAGIQPAALQDLPANPFTYAVELIRFAFYGQIEWTLAGRGRGVHRVFLAGAIIAYDPSRGLVIKKQEGGNN